MLSDITSETQTSRCVFKVPVKNRGGKKKKKIVWSKNDAFVSCEILTTYCQCYPIAAFVL